MVERLKTAGLSLQRDSSDAFQNISIKNMIACTARSGSGALASSLGRYKFNFNEYFNPGGYIKNICDQHSIRDFDDLAKQIANNAVVNGSFDLKLGYAASGYLVLFNEIPTRIDQWKIVFLTRRNLVRQAISALKAQATGQWTFGMSPVGDLRESDYDFDVILKTVTDISAQNARWERFFAIFRINPHRVVYEDFLSDEFNVVSQVATYFGRDIKRYPDAASHITKHRIQSTRINEVWEERFHEDIATRLK